MPVLVQIRDVPEDVHRVLKARAAAEGVSFSEYLRTLLAQSARRPSPAELLERIRSRDPVQLSEPIEDTVRAIRAAAG